ncbi:SDR family oxidoreductase [Pelomonas sp. KK5]|uniref:SDR family oxidoreductase n=1 Tax=Pelomonas sp. KK5 TaxID=1855730 RepID=UPI00097C0258|nr:SDR family oxidoreductase [Pelomonas sp. KK5]
MSKPLAHKVALVTGGSRGIGAAIARRLAQDGADVAISYSASADRAEALVKELIALGARATADRTPWPGVADYSATKAAVSAYTRGWARDLAPRGITVNTVQPGSVDTELNPQHGDFAAVQKAAIPLARYARPEEIAAAVAFLAGPEASFITGIALDVDGGAAA